MATDRFLERTYAARDQYAETLGTVEPDVLAPLINPQFMGGPSWPDLRQAWRVIRRGQSTIVMSDGLADPFSDEPDENAGFELEVLAETPDELSEQLQTTWLFDLAYQVSQQCAHHGGVRALIDRLGLISLELPLSSVLEPVATENETAGVLLGIAPPDFDAKYEGPCGTVRVITAKLLWPSELEYAAEEGKAGREELANRFAADRTYHRSSLLRKPVV